VPAGRRGARRRRGRSRARMHPPTGEWGPPVLRVGAGLELVALDAPSEGEGNVITVTDRAPRPRVGRIDPEDGRVHGLRPGPRDSRAAVAVSPPQPVVILLVEDDPGDQELIRRALSAGKLRTELHIVSDGQEAVDFLWHRGMYRHRALSPQPDLVILDLNLPKLDGLQVLEWLKEDPKRRRIPVVVLATPTGEENLARSYDLGCNSFVAKPAHLDEFFKVTRALEAYWFRIAQLSPY
jgi:CheY-like chemotaxis protein